MLIGTSNAANALSFQVWLKFAADLLFRALFLQVLKNFLGLFGRVFRFLCFGVGFVVELILFVVIRSMLFGEREEFVRLFGLLRIRCWN